MSSDYRTGSIRALAISGKCRRYMYLSGREQHGAARNEALATIQLPAYTPPYCRRTRSLINRHTSGTHSTKLVTATIST